MNAGTGELGTGQSPTSICVIHPGTAAPDSIIRHARTMNARRYYRLLLLFLLFVPPLPLLPNDFEAGWHGEDVTLLSTGRIRMVSEDILIDQSWPDASLWFVDASYVLENLTGDTLTVNVGFPEPTFDSLPRFREYRTLVGGNEVDYRVARSTVIDGESEYGTTYVVEVTFLPHQQVSVQHRYEYYGDSWAGGIIVGYVTATGRSWAGPIERARFTINTYLDGSETLPFATTVMPKEYATPEFRIERIRMSDFVKEHSYLTEESWNRDWYDEIPTDLYRSTWVFEQNDWIPQTDLDLTIDRVWSGVEICEPDPPLSSRMAHPWSNDELLATPFELVYAYLACRSDSALEHDRNMLRAMWGAPFEDRNLNTLFYSSRPGHLYDEPEDADTTVLTYRMMPNTAFTEDLIPEESRRIDSLLQAVIEARRRGKQPGDLAELLHFAVLNDTPQVGTIERQLFDPGSGHTYIVRTPDVNDLKTKVHRDILAALLAPEQVLGYESLVGSSGRLVPAVAGLMSGPHTELECRVRYLWAEYGLFGYTATITGDSIGKDRALYRAQVVNLQNGERVRPEEVFIPDSIDALVALLDERVQESITVRLKAGADTATFRDRTGALRHFTRDDLINMQPTCNYMFFNLDPLEPFAATESHARAALTWDEIKPWLKEGHPFHAFLYFDGECR